MKKYSIGLLAFLFAAMASFTTIPKKDKLQPPTGYAYFHYTGTSIADENDPLKYQFISYTSDAGFDCDQSQMLCTILAPVKGEEGQEELDYESLHDYPTISIREDNNVTVQSYQVEP